MQSDSPVSICIPTYNQSVFLRKTLDSLCTQTYNHFEVVIADDSTTDDVSKLVAEYHDRLIIRYSKNPVRLGSPANWNRCLELATGNLIKFIHHDDWFAKPYALEKFVAVFQESDQVNIVFCASEILDTQTNKTSVHRVSPDFLSKLHKDARVLFDNNQIGAPTAVMFRKTTEKFDTHLKYLVDIDFYIRLIKNKQSVSYIDEPLIVNTSNNSEQVTAASLNKETQLREYTYLYEKIYPQQIPSKELSLFFIRLFVKYGIENETDLLAAGSSLPQPQWYFKILLLLTKLKR